MKLKSLIVDDEPLARKGMLEYIREFEFLECVAQSSNAAQATKVLNETKIDLILLDIQMPGTSGLEFLRELKDPPMVIITTAFTEFALEGFELDVIDYLVKPIPISRFTRAVNKAMDFHRLKHGNYESASVPFIFVKSNGKFERIQLDEILFVEAMQNYVIIHVTGHKYIVYMTMSGMEAKLPSEQFMRVHKSYIAALGKVNSIDDHDLLIDQFRIPVSRNLRDQVQSKVLGSNLLKR